ncbi:MAG: tRNA lysidine(34) synthetase TilS [Ruminococcus sp.]|nr:tRNA lysidine(34) synthetase TilS [Ruminococcus sp.]
MKAELENTVLGTIEKYDMLKKGERLLVGLSGGADSTALLLCLVRLGYDVMALHVNHQLRGEESERDQHFCRELCERLGVKLKTVRINVKQYCQVNSLSTEEGARILRYKAFEEQDSDKICTAHNLDDVLETAVFNLARGSGLKGVSSIPPVRGSIVRPLIECSREMIEDYLAQLQQDHVTDSTNLTDDYSRNKIRHRVIPVLRELNPSLSNTYRSTAQFLRDDSLFLEKLADRAFEDCRKGDGYSRSSINGLDISVRRRVIMRILSENAGSASGEMILLLDELCKNGGKLCVKENYFAQTRSDLLFFFKNNDIGQCTEVIVTPNISVDRLGRRVSFELSPKDSENVKVHKKFANSYLDYDKIIGKVVLRQRQAGDRIKLVNREFTSDVRILMKQKYRAFERAGVVILADDEGVIFVEGFGCADRVKVSAETERILNIRIQG